MVGAIVSVLDGWPGPSAWRHLHRATRNNILELAKQGKLHPDKHVAAIAVEWARWRRELSPWRQLGIAIATIATMQAAMGLLFLLLTLIPGGETTYDGSPLRWVQITGGLVLAIWRLMMVPSSAAYEILRLHALTVEHDQAEPAESVGMSTPPRTWPLPGTQEPTQEATTRS
jgi:hypothetical protein